MGRVICVVALIGLAGSTAVTAQAAVPPSGTEAIAALNAQRRANGVALPVRPSADLDQGCVNHLRYNELNPDSNLVTEDPSRPGYTPLGAADPASSPDYRHPGGWTLLLSYAYGYVAPFTWTPTSHPWVFGPGHAAAMFDPTMTVAGYGAITRADGSVHHCMRVTGFQPTPGTTLKAYTAAGGRNAVPASFTVNAEGPISPYQVVGLPLGAAAGPVITLYAYRPGRTPLRNLSYVLRDSRKRRIRSVKLIQGSAGGTPASAAMHGPASALVVTKPLRAGATYRATLVWRVGRRGRATQVVRFRTVQG